MKVDYACAYCLEEAGGRQRQHNIHWAIAHCQVCGRQSAVTHPENFGNPPLKPTVLTIESEVICQPKL